NTRLSGSEWATFLLGALGDTSRARNTPFLRAHNHFYGLYVQDDFKVSQNITLNIGLRWEYDTPITDPEGRLSRTVALTKPIPRFQGPKPRRLPASALALRKQLPVYNGAWIFADTPSSGAYNSPKTVFLPRFGIAWRLNDRTSLRFGYARYTIQPSVDYEGGI